MQETRLLKYVRPTQLKRRGGEERREKLKRLLRTEYNVVTLYSAYIVDFLFFNCLNNLIAYVVLC